MLNLIGSFQFRDHTTLCKNRNPPAQRPWHSIETTRNKQEEKNQLRERQHENTNMDLKKKKTHRYMHSKSILSQQWILLFIYFFNSVAWLSESKRLVFSLPI